MKQGAETSTVSPFAIDGADVNSSEKCSSPAGNRLLTLKSQQLRSRQRLRQQNHRPTSNVKVTHDILWQENPDRILKYRVHNLHYYGWIPFVIFRNFKATVFSDIYIHVQGGLLLCWVGLIHGCGLGIDSKDHQTFVKIFGTTYAGSIFNLGMVIVFILGLFISLVINRWSGIRQSYAKLMGTTIDLCMVIANVIHSEYDWSDFRTLRARAELTRLLNLGHFLVLCRADALGHEFRKAVGLRTIAKICTDKLKKTFFKANVGGTPVSEEEGADTWHQVWQKKVRFVDYHDLLNEGLINPDEWEMLREAEKEGLPSYQTVYYWASNLVHKCRAAEWIVSGQQMLPLLLGKINNIVDSASQILGAIDSQMPYPYVHLVSFVAHAYLFILSTWFGSFLYVGYPDGESFAGALGPNGTTLFKTNRVIKNNAWTVFFCYFMVAIANIIFQGLLNMHTLLDNPFGNHCAKFPLRAQVGKVMNATRTMLTNADQLPRAFGDVFQLPDDEEIDRSEDERDGRRAPVVDFCDFLHPPSETGGIESVSSSALTRSKSAKDVRLSTLTRSKSAKDVRSIKDLGSPSFRSGLSDRPSRRRRHLSKEMEPVDEAAGGSENRTSDEHVATTSHVVRFNDDEMVRLMDPQSAPKTTKCVSRGVSIHNQVLFGNLEKQPSMNSTGDPALQELYLRVAVADAMEHSFSTLQSSVPKDGIIFDPNYRSSQDDSSRQGE